MTACDGCRFDGILGCTYHKPCDAESAPPIPGCPSKKIKIDRECYSVCKGPRPCVAEEAAPVERRGNKAICPDCDGVKGMCQPENHPGGRGACGKAIAPVVDADGMQRENFAARGRV